MFKNVSIIYIYNANSKYILLRLKMLNVQKTKFITKINDEQVILFLSRCNKK